jgi:hypothetical protein
MTMGLGLFLLGVALGATGVWLRMRRYRIDLVAREGSTRAPRKPQRSNA